jgi:hypothetical protein
MQQARAAMTAVAVAAMTRFLAAARNYSRSLQEQQQQLGAMTLIKQSHQLLVLTQQPRTNRKRSM